MTSTFYRVPYTMTLLPAFQPARITFVPGVFGLTWDLNLGPSIWVQYCTALPHCLHHYGSAPSLLWLEYGVFGFSWRAVSFSGQPFNWNWLNSVSPGQKHTGFCSSFLPFIHLFIQSCHVRGQERSVEQNEEGLILFKCRVHLDDFCCAYKETKLLLLFKMIIISPSIEKNPVWIWPHQSPCLYSAYWACDVCHLHRRVKGWDPNVPEWKALQTAFHTLFLKKFVWNSGTV